jgi:hypothetical protein
MQRILASQQTRERVKTPMDGAGGSGRGSVKLVRLEVRLINEDALEGKAADTLDRGSCAQRRGSRAGLARAVARIARERDGHDYLLF